MINIFDWTDSAMGKINKFERCGCGKNCWSNFDSLLMVSKDSRLISDDISSQLKTENYSKPIKNVLGEHPYIK